MSVEIPYITIPREDTGLVNGKLGIWLFLASEVMLFGGLFSAYVLLRVGAPVWPPVGTPPLNIPLATLNTFILITSSITMILAWASLVRDQFSKYRMYTLITLLCGAGFMVIKYIEYSAKLSHNFYPSTNTFLAIYFTLTGLHGLHVVGGMVVLAVLAIFGKKWYARNKTLFTDRVENAGLFWHLVDLVWIFLFPSLYLM